MKTLKIFLTLFSINLLTSCAVFFIPDSENHFIKVNGTKFELHGKSYYFVGTNLWYGCYLGSAGNTGDRERLKRELDMLSSIGVNNLRVCAASEESIMISAVKPAIQKSPGVYEEELLEGLDFLLSEMQKRSMHAVLYLNNYWQWSGGMAQYNEWFDGGEIADPDNPVIGYEAFMDYSAKFYSNEKAAQQFREYIKMLVNRENKFTGMHYYEDPTIMSWQLANEPRPGRQGLAEKDIEEFYQWIDETAKYIHSLDSNHLVSTGSEGIVGTLGSEEFFLKAHESKFIDYLTFHLWAKNWVWFDAAKADETFPATQRNAFDYINQHIKYGKMLNKPITMEEFGLPRDNEKFSKSSTTNYRDKYFKILYDLIEDSIATDAAIAGTNFWAWGGEGSAMQEDTLWHPGDPYTGDPPQEPQGLNSVFDSDESTLRLMRYHAFRLRLFSE